MRYTPFSLFIKQALQYPLASPFLPAEADVKKDVSYANGKLLGTYSPLGPELIFQPEPNLNFTWDNAQIYADYLEIDGETVSEEYQGIWHIPTIEEFFTAIDYSTYSPAADESKVPNIQSYPYWSSTTYASYSDYAWFAHFDDGNIYFDTKSQSYYVRCVR